MIPSKRSHQRKVNAGPSRVKRRSGAILETVEEDSQNGTTVHSVFERRVGQTEFLEHDYKGKSAASTAGIKLIRDYSKLHPAAATSAQHQEMLVAAELRVRELENKVRLGQLENDRFTMRVGFVKGLIEKGVKKEEIGGFLAYLDEKQI
jgi:hypothetical protein